MKSYNVSACGVGDNNGRSHQLLLQFLFHCVHLCRVLGATWLPELIAATLVHACGPTRCTAVRFRSAPAAALYYTKNTDGSQT